jgi:putative oxidoreductase
MSSRVSDAGRVLLAVPMLIYPVLHFVYTDFVATIVPPWIPWHYFWTYFTAISIFAAGIAILARKFDRLAAALLGIEILLFCLLIHVPFLFHSPGDPWAGRPQFGDMPSRWMNAPKDFGLSGAAFLYANREPFFSLGRAILSIAIAGCGILHLVYPAFAPGIAPMQVAVQFPLPGHLAWVYLTAAAFLAIAVGIWIPAYARRAALALGAIILFFDLLNWMPVFVNQPSQLTGNWLKDVGVAGGTWILAGRASANRSLQSSQKEQKELHSGVGS